MEKNFYPDNFEQLLKDTTNDFRMYPSKRVWHSIYNDLHPSRKWPSLAVCLLLISSIMYVGLSNRNDVSINAIGASKLPKEETTKLSTALSSTTSKPVIAQFSNKSQKRNMLTDVKALSPSVTDQYNAAGNQQGELTVKISNNAGILNADDRALAEKIAGYKTDQNGTSLLALNGSSTDHLINDSKTENGLKKNQKPVVQSLAADKEWIEDYAFHNKPFSSKWRSRVTYQLYMTPSVGYRTLSKNTSYNTVVSSSLVSTPAAGSTDLESAVSQVAAVNMEVGGNILYSVTQRINLKLGVQFNYSNYNINAYDLKHPTVTTVMLNDLTSGYPLLVSKPTSLANIDGIYNTKLNNNTYQLSLPIGADIKLAGKNNLNWFAGATIQPTYIMGGNAYLVSSDLKNYVDGNSMMRTWNLNAGVETFLSYKTKSGIILNAGPQFRYQVLSTLTPEYTYDEKLYNIGVKIGVITKF
ncbi:MAG: hypothetical protein ABIO04_03450 [Ferruginibacter sp.]